MTYLIGNTPIGYSVVAAPAGALCYETVAAMQAASLTVGQVVQTLGYHAVYDGGGAQYRIVAAATGTEDGGQYIDLATHQARLIQQGDTINVRLFGAYGDGTHNDQAAIQAAVVYAEAAGLATVDIPAGTFLVYGLSDANVGTRFYTMPCIAITKPINFIGAGRAYTFFEHRYINGDKPSDSHYTAAAYNAGSTYAIDDYCIYGDYMQVCISTIAAPEAWNAAHWTRPSNPLLAYYAHYLTNGFKIGEFSVYGNWDDPTYYAQSQNFIRIDRYNNSPSYACPRDILLENIDITGFGAEAMISPASTLINGIARNINFDYCARSNVNIHGQVTVDNCTFNHGGSHPIEFAIAPNNTAGFLHVFNCKFYDCTTFASMISVINKNEFVYTDALDNDYPSLAWGNERGTNVIIRGNKFIGVADAWLSAAAYDCIHLTEIETALVEGNWFQDYSKGTSGYLIATSQVNSLIFRGNHLVDNVRDSVRIFLPGGVRHLIVEGNDHVYTHIKEYGVLSSYGVIPQTSSLQNMTVRATSAITGVTANNALAIATAHETNPRIDLVYLSSGNVFTVATGTPAAEPSVPATPEGGTALATVAVAAGITAITGAMITDLRTLSRAKAFPILYSCGSWTDVVMPESMRVRGNIFEAVYDNLVIPGTSASIQALGSIPYFHKDITLHVIYSVTCAVGGTLKLRLLSVNADYYTFDALCYNVSITDAGLTGEVDYIVPYGSKSYGNGNAALALYGCLDGGGSGGKVSIRVSIKDFDYYKV